MPNKPGHSHVPITPENLLEQLEAAKGILSKPVEPPSGAPTTSTQLPSLTAAVFERGGGDIPMGETATIVLLAIREGVQVGLHLAAQYDRTSGLVDLQLRNQTGTLGTDEARYRSLTATASAIAVYGAARYALWRLSRHREDEIRTVTVGDLPQPAIAFGGRVAALQDLAWHLTSVADQSASELAMAASFIHVLTGVVADIVARAPSLQAKEPFEQVAYQLQGSDFIVDGFELPNGRRGISVEIAPIRTDQIVGNHEAKHLAKRIAQRLALYDFEKKRNPFCDVGLFQMILMVFGIPGTGKTLRIRLIATMLKDLCERRGVPLDISLLPSIVSTYQGGSAANMENWMRRVRNPQVVSFAAIDDAENVLQDRTGKTSSEGTQGVIQVFLTETEGAGSIIRGNANIVVATNIPDMIDRAVLSRIQVRMELKGARGFKDLVDQNYLGLQGISKLFPNELKDIKTLAGYELLSAQRTGTSLAAAAGAYGEPKQEMTRKATEAALASGKEKQALVLPSRICDEFQKIDPRFSSRDLRNIQSAVSDRFADFDIPSEFYDEPKVFFQKPYDERVGMLGELARGAGRGLSLGDVLLEETLRYLDGFAQIGNAQFNRKVAEAVEQMKVIEEATRQLEKAP